MFDSEFPVEFVTPDELTAHIQKLQKLRDQMTRPNDRACLRCGTVYPANEDSYKKKGQVVKIYRPIGQCHCGPEWDE